MSLLERVTSFVVRVNRSGLFLRLRIFHSSGKSNLLDALSSWMGVMQPERSFALWKDDIMLRPLGTVDWPEARVYFCEVESNGIFCRIAWSTAVTVCFSGFVQGKRRRLTLLSQAKIYA